MTAASLDDIIEVPSGAEPVYTGEIGGDGPDDMSRDDWLEARRGGVGGSDASAICNVNRFSSPLEVWLQKAGEKAGFTLPPDDLAERNEAVFWGIELEDTVARVFARRTGLDLAKPKAMYWDRSSSFPRYANPDRFVFDPDVGVCPLEIKTCSAYLAEDWKDDDTPADHALVQTHHYAAVLGYEWAWVAVLIGGQKMKQCRIRIDPELAENVGVLEERFWRDHVETLTPPPATAVDNDLLTTILQAREGTVSLPPETEDLWADYIGALDAQKDAKSVKDTIAAKIKMHLGENGRIGELDGRPLFTWSMPYDIRSVPAENLDRLKVLHPDIYDEFVVTTPQRRLTANRRWGTTT